MKAPSLMAMALMLTIAVCAQPITTFPHLENFETFTLGNQGSSVEPNPNAFGNGWLNENVTDNPQDWYCVSGSTPSTNTGPTGDHTTGSGQYIYVEDSGVDNDSVGVVSPIFLVDALTNPSLSYYVHSQINLVSAQHPGDSSYNHLIVEISSSLGNWQQIDSVSALGADWEERLIDLSAYSAIPFRLRFRVSNNNYGDFVHDIAIDDVLIFDQPEVDILVREPFIELQNFAEYSIAPYSQKPIYSLGVTVENNGLATAHNVWVKVDFTEFTDSVLIDSLVFKQDSVVNFPKWYFPEDYTLGEFTVRIDEMDTFQNNNTAYYLLIDSVFARDNNQVSGSLGFTGGTGEMGNMFELTVPDVLTSASCYLGTSPLGDSARFMLYPFDANNSGVPGLRAIDSTQYFLINANNRWRTMAFTCPIPLGVGKYFIAVEQVNTNNLGLGYDTTGRTPGTTFFGGRAVGSWTDIETVPNLASALMVRMNFSVKGQTDITGAVSPVCKGSTVTLQATGSGSFTWTGDSVFLGSNNVLMHTPADTVNSVSYGVTLTNANGCVSTDVVTVNFSDPPTTTMGFMPSVGDSSNGAMLVNVTGGTPPFVYSWSNGDNTRVVTEVDSGLYTVTVTDAAGCMVMDTVFVRADSIPTPPVGVNNVVGAEINLYPNPAREVVLVKGIGKHSTLLNIYNGVGALVHQEWVAENTVVRLQDWQPGVYIFELQLENGMARKKLVKY